MSRCEIQQADSERPSFDTVSVGDGYSICILKQIYEAQDIVCILGRAIGLYWKYEFFSHECALTKIWRKLREGKQNIAR
jgi:hypothetical protein